MGANDGVVYRRIFNRLYQKSIRRFQEHDALDLAQEAVLRRLTGKGNDGIAYHLGILRNLENQRFRQRYKDRSMFSALDPNAVAAAECDPLQGRKAQERRSLLFAWLDKLSLRQREAIEQLLQGRDDAHAARELGIELHSYRSLLSRARTRLRELATRHMNDRADAIF